MTQSQLQGFIRTITCLSCATICFLMGCDPSTKNTTDVKSTANSSSSKASSNGDGKSNTTKKGTESAAKTNPVSSVRWTSHGEDIGVKFSYQNGEAAWLVAMIESMGGGIGVIDFDRDGAWDLFAPGGGLLSDKKVPIMVPNGLFQQIAPLRFKNNAVPSHTDAGVCYSFGANVGDYDEDGFADVFITGYLGQQLLHNMGDGTFEDVTMDSGFKHRGWSSTSAWADIDQDGDLDLYVAHYGVWSPELEKPCLNVHGEPDRCIPADFEGEPDELWLNESNGTFTDVSDRIVAGPFRGVGVVACDWNNDDRIDFYVTNDEQPNTMFLNQGNGRFDEIGSSSGTAMGSRSMVDGSMGIAVGDFDGNLKPDLLITNYQNEYNELFMNETGTYFSLGTRASGLMALGQAVVGWGTAFLDADHDADEDLLIVAGHTSRRPIKSTNLQKSFFLDNINRKRLISIGESTGEYFTKVHAGRGAAIGDFDNDGDIDCVVSMLEQPVELLENATPRSGNYLLLDLVGTQSNRDAVGASVTCQTGALKQIRFRISGGSYACTHSSSVHFGLASAKQIDELVIRWPSGQSQTLNNVQANQRLTVIEPRP